MSEGRLHRSSDTPRQSTVMTPISSRDFFSLVGQDLSGVTFVRDYLQLHFNPPPLLNALTPVTVRSGEGSAVFGEPAFANLILKQIGKLVASVDFRAEESLDLQFEDGSLIAISLRQEHYVGPEAINLFLPDNSMIVV